MSVPDTESLSMLRVVIAFGVVIVLLAGFGFVMKYIGQRGIRMPGITPATRRMRIVETLPLDVRRRLVIVRCDDEEHLLLLGVNQDIVVAGMTAENQPSVAGAKVTKVRA